MSLMPSNPQSSEVKSEFYSSEQVLSILFLERVEQLQGNKILSQILSQQREVLSTFMQINQSMLILS